MQLCSGSTGFCWFLRTKNYVKKWTWRCVCIGILERTVWLQCLINWSMCKCSYSVDKLVLRTKSESRNEPDICARVAFFKGLSDCCIWLNWRLWMCSYSVDQINYFLWIFKNAAPNEEINLKVVCKLAFLRGMSYCSVWLIEQCLSAAIQKIN